ncbi:MAG TPA: ABC transporter ATP-binding protein, partial [Devosia sp.]|nr:ABC transporter ATP-binding protein [Devosia sp.]
MTAENKGTVLSLKGIRAGYGDTQVLDNISLEVEKG